MSPHPPSPGHQYQQLPGDEATSLVDHHHHHHHHHHHYRVTNADKKVHRHPPHHGHDMPLSPSAPDLREFEDIDADAASVINDNGDASSSSSSSSGGGGGGGGGNGSSDDVGVDAGAVSLSSSSSIGSDSDEDDDYFHDAEEYSVAASSTVSSVHNDMLGLLMLDGDDDDDDDDELVRRLSPELEALAAKELNEDPTKRTAMLRDFRHWVRTNPSMKRCRLGENLFIYFLTFHHFYYYYYYYYVVFRKPL